MRFQPTPMDSNNKKEINILIDNKVVASAKDVPEFLSKIGDLTQKKVEFLSENVISKELEESKPMQPESTNLQDDSEVDNYQESDSILSGLTTTPPRPGPEAVRQPQTVLKNYLNDNKNTDELSPIVKVVFEIEQIGMWECQYHDVYCNDRFLVLIYDQSRTDVPKYTPAYLVDKNGHPIQTAILVEKVGVLPCLYSGYYFGLVFPHDRWNYTVFVVDKKKEFDSEDVETIRKELQKAVHVSDFSDSEEQPNFDANPDCFL
jgi:hypothetical protein